MKFEVRMKPPGETLAAYHCSRSRVGIIIGPLGCTDADTEFLTPAGWQRIADYRPGDRVAQWNDGRMEFVYPSGYINEPCEEMWMFRNDHSVSMMLSDRHRMPLYSGSGEFVVKRAEDVAARPSRHTVPVNFRSKNPGIGLTETGIRLRAMIAADGHYLDAGRQCIVSVRKQRKKERLRWLLDSAGIDWQEKTGEDRPTETTRFIFLRPGFEKSLHMSADWYGASSKELEILLDEISHWDGLANHAEHRYITSRKEEADVVQFAAHACGRVARVHAKAYTDKPKWAVQWTTAGSRKGVVGFRGDNIDVTRARTPDGRMYCFSVPSTYWIARREGRIFVTGNSGKTYQSCQRLLTHMCEQAPDAQDVRKTRFYAIRNTYPDLLSTTAKDWLELFGDLGRFKGGGQEPPTHYLSFRLEDGTRVQSELVFIALDRPDHVKKLRGAQCTGFWLSEVKELDKSVVDMCDLRHGRYPSMMDGGPTWHGMIGDSNAPDEDHWLFEQAEEVRPANWAFFIQPGGVVRAGVTPEGHVIWHPSPDAENLKNLPGDYYSQGMEGKSDDWVAVNLGNEYGTVVSGKVVYPEYSDRVHLSPVNLEVYGGLPLIVGWDFGLCYDNQTEVLTESGWKYFTDVNENTDRVATRDSDTGALEYTDINFKVDRHYEGELIGWSSTEVDMLVTPEHRVPFTYRDTPEKVHFAEARWLAENSGGHHFVDLRSDWVGAPINDIPCDMEEHIFARFLGWWCSDGSLDKDRISICQVKEAEGLEPLLTRTGLSWSEGGGHQYRTTSKELSEWLRNNCGFLKTNQRRVPKQIRDAGRQTIRTFLNAYTAGDGHIRRRHNGASEWTIFTPNREMAGDLQELAQKSGFNSSMRTQKGRTTYMASESRFIESKDGYVITIKRRASRAELLRDNFTKVQYSGRIYCLNVPYHTLYVRRNGKPHWNGNTPAAIICQVSRQGQLRVIDELVSDDTGVTQFTHDIVLPHLSNHYHGIEVVSSVDPSGVARKDTDMDTCVNILESAGLNPRPARTNDFVPRREAVSVFLNKMVSGQPGFLLDPRCKVLRKGFTGGYHYRRIQLVGEARYTDKPDKNRYSHPHDALQYGCLEASGEGRNKQSGVKVRVGGSRNINRYAS